jgi:hypothetical protein
VNVSQIKFRSEKKDKDDDDDDDDDNNNNNNNNNSNNNIRIISLIILRHFITAASGRTSSNAIRKANIRKFIIHLVVCLTTGPKPPPK